MSTRIVRTPGIVGGKPRLDGTRWYTAIVVGWEFDRAAMIDAYPHLTPEQIDAAIRYERRLHRRLGRWVWRVRERVGYWLIGEEWE